MAFTTEVQKKIDYLRASVRLQAPDTETDPAYKFTDEELHYILETVTPAHNSTYDIATLPNTDVYYVMLLAKKEIFYRLASSTAPFYPLSAEGAKLEKNVRFDHYMALIKSLQDEYDNMTEAGNSGDDAGAGNGTVQTYQALLWGKPYAKRYHELADNPLVDLSISGVTQTSVNLDWSKYSNTHGTHFDRYAIYFATAPIYDEYGVDPIDKTLKPNYVLNDVRRTKLRISGLLPDTEYFVLVRTDSRIGLTGFSQKSFRTEAVSVDAPI